jgi:uncharacterized RmlC-like cupin family protein
VAAVAQVRREEEGEQDVRGAEGRVCGDRLEEREPVVAGGVLVAPLGVPGAVADQAAG